MGKIKKCAGFTLIEVVVALGIFMIVVLALLGGYYSYYNSVKDLRYKSICQNLAQLQLEDLQNMSSSWHDFIVQGNIGDYGAVDQYNSIGNDNYPPSIALRTPAVFFKLSDGSIEKVFVFTYDANGNVTRTTYNSDPGTVDQNKSIVVIYFTDDPNGPVKSYDSGMIDGSFRIGNIANVCVHDASGNTICSDNSPATNPTGQLPPLILPESIVVVPVEMNPPSPDPSYYNYTLTLYKEVFPSYLKRIKITDEDPQNIDLNKKIYKIEVTVYWTQNGVTKSITITGESYAKENPPPPQS